MAVPKNGVSVQEKNRKNYKKGIKKKIKINGAGRTDKGVHALNQCANFKTIHNIGDKTKFLNSINFFLNKNLITIKKIKKKKDNFHSRFSAKERIYEYIIINRTGPLSLYKNKAWHIKKQIDVKLLKKRGKVIRGYT